MALKLKLGKSDFEKLSADVKKEYKADGDDYVLDLEGYEDPAALKAARDHEKAEGAAAKRAAAAEKTRADAAEAKAAALESKDVDKAKAIADTEKVWKERLESELGAEKGKTEKAVGSIKSRLANSKALEIATKISHTPALLAPEIAKRIEVELGDDYEPVIRFKDAAGKISASTAEDVQKEFFTNKTYSGIMIASKGSGGGSAPRVGPGGGSAPRDNNPPNSQDGKPVDLSKLAPKELAEQMRASIEARNAGGTT